MRPIRTSADGPDRSPPDCNLCGLTCLLGKPEYANSGGLERVTVRGTFDSTAGNGGGALDDCASYSFSLCEWCLDWIFSLSALPPDVRDTRVDGTPEEAVEWRPAERRVAEDEWRAGGRAKFAAEKDRRDAAREAASDRARRHQGSGQPVEGALIVPAPDPLPPPAFTMVPTADPRQLTIDDVVDRAIERGDWRKP